MASRLLCRGLSDEIQTRHLLVLQEANREEEGFLIKDGIVVVTKGELGSLACCSEERTLTKARAEPLRVFAPVCFAKKPHFDCKPSKTSFGSRWLSSVLPCWPHSNPLAVADSQRCVLAGAVLTAGTVI